MRLREDGDVGVDVVGVAVHEQQPRLEVDRGWWRELLGLLRVNRADQCDVVSADQSDDKRVDEGDGDRVMKAVAIRVMRVMGMEEIGVE